MNFYFFVKDCKAFHFKYGNLETIVLSVIISGTNTRLWRNNLKQDCSTKKSHPMPHPSFSLSVPLNLPFFCCTPLSSASPVDLPTELTAYWLLTAYRPFLFTSTTSSPVYTTASSCPHLWESFPTGLSASLCRLQVHSLLCSPSAPVQTFIHATSLLKTSVAFCNI